MHFRKIKRQLTEVYINEPLETDSEGNTLTIADILSSGVNIEEETELAVFTSGGTGGPRLILVGSALIPEKATRDTAGINMVTLKKNARIAKVRLAAGLELKDPHRYRVRTLPAAGALLRQEDTTEQMSL